MRLAPIPPDQLNDAQRPLDARFREGIREHLQGFVSERRDGALVGPFIPMLHFPEFGAPSWGVMEALMAHSTLPKTAHEVAILVTGARFSTRYEIYAHEKVAERAGLSAAKIATLVAGCQPPDLDEDESAAFNVAAVLNRGAPLPESVFRAAVARFGEKGVAELVFLIGSYQLVSTMLNAYDVSVPGREDGIG